MTNNTGTNNNVLSADELRELKIFSESIAGDLILLSTIQRTELTNTSIRQLLELDFPNNLSLELIGNEAKEAKDFLNQSMLNLKENLTINTIDDLAVDFANIYLVHTYQSSPYESVWLDEESLLQQQPTFDIQKEYDKHHLQFNEKDRYADHICLQLEFIAYLLNNTKSYDQLIEAGLFMDNHILRWVKLFSIRVAKHSLTEFYAGILVFITEYLDQLRTLIVEITGQERIKPVVETEQAFKGIPLKFVPGVAKSW